MLDYYTIIFFVLQALYRLLRDLSLSLCLQERQTKRGKGLYKKIAPGDRARRSSYVSVLNLVFILRQNAKFVNSNFITMLLTFVGLQYIYDTVMKKETEGKREENKG